MLWMMWMLIRNLAQEQQNAEGTLQAIKEEKRSDVNVDKESITTTTKWWRNTPSHKIREKGKIKEKVIISFDYVLWLCSIGG